jgi:hypothetical protein
LITARNCEPEGGRGRVRAKSTGGFGHDPASPLAGWPQTAGRRAPDTRPHTRGKFVIDGGGAKPYLSLNAEVASIA